MDKESEQYKEERRQQNRLSKQRARARAKEKLLCSRCCKNNIDWGVNPKTKKDHKYCTACLKWYKESNAKRHEKRKYGECFLPKILPEIIVKIKKPRRKHAPIPTQ